jgi:hypothetical protein
LLAPEPGVRKAKTYFEQTLAIALQQRVKSWELRVAMSLARLGEIEAGASQPVHCSRACMVGFVRASKRPPAGEDVARHVDGVSALADSA